MRNTKTRSHPPRRLSDAFKALPARGKRGIQGEALEPGLHSDDQKENLPDHRSKIAQGCVDSSELRLASHPVRSSGETQCLTTLGLMTDNRVALILVDYPRQLRLKILGRVEVFEGKQARKWINKVRDPEYKAFTERVSVIRIEAFDWNCQQHIVPRYTDEEIREAVASRKQNARIGARKREASGGDLATWQEKRKSLTQITPKEKMSCLQSPRKKERISTTRTGERASP
jgi:hypothetical protein